MGSSLRRSHHAWLLKVLGVLATCFAAGSGDGGSRVRRGPTRDAVEHRGDGNLERVDGHDRKRSDRACRDRHRSHGDDDRPSQPPSTPCVQTGDEIVLTNRSDYDPGETVFITGSGYAASCDVTIKVTRPDGSVVKGDGCVRPWKRPRRHRRRRRAHLRLRSRRHPGRVPRPGPRRRRDGPRDHDVLRRRSASSWRAGRQRAAPPSPARVRTPVTRTPRTTSARCATRARTSSAPSSGSTRLSRPTRSASASS